MEAKRFFRTSVNFFWTTWHQIPEDTFHNPTYLSINILSAQLSTHSACNISIVVTFLYVAKCTSKLHYDKDQTF
jgi:hypothetical protein